MSTFTQCSLSLSQNPETFPVLANGVCTDQHALVGAPDVHRPGRRLQLPEDRVAGPTQRQHESGRPGQRLDPGEHQADRCGARLARSLPLSAGIGPGHLRHLPTRSCLAGFYRVNYDDANWARLTTLLQTQNNNVPVLNRAQLLDDALSLARAGLLRYPVALNLTRYLSAEKDPIPWTAALGHLDFLGKMLAGDAGQTAFNVSARGA